MTEAIVGTFVVRVLDTVASSDLLDHGRQITVVAETVTAALRKAEKTISRPRSSRKTLGDVVLRGEDRRLSDRRAASGL